ncbi:MAG: hypothetical protein NXY59_05750 [Aigarchaeota archaeon]|nr:hypothetical protein [Candidatus Pelearchaeum maunauluense]
MGGVEIACRAALSGFRTTFYAPNPFVVSQALKYNPRMSEFIKRREFIRLVSDERLKSKTSVDGEFEVVWVSANILSPEGERFRDVENLIRGLGQLNIECNCILLSGLNPIGSTVRLIERIQLYEFANDAEIGYFGCPHRVVGKQPAYCTDDSRLAQLVKHVFGREIVYLDSLEEAEMATLLNLLNTYVSSAVALELIAAARLGGSRLIPGFKNYNDEVLAATRYLFGFERSKPRLTKIVMESIRIHKILSQDTLIRARRRVNELAKKKGEINVLAVIDSKEDRNIVAGVLPSKRCRVSYRMSDELSEEKDIDGIIHGYDVLLFYTEFGYLVESMSRMCRDRLTVIDLNKPFID